MDRAELLRRFDVREVAKINPDVTTRIEIIAMPRSDNRSGVMAEAVFRAAQAVFEELPDCPERDTAIVKCQEAMYWAEAGTMRANSLGVRQPEPKPEPGAEAGGGEQ